MYQVIRYSNRFTIAEYSGFYDAYIINDGIYGWYAWDTLDDAQRACDLYNKCGNVSFLWQHEPIFDDEISDYDVELVDIYRAFNMIKSSNERANVVQYRKEVSA